MSKNRKPKDKKIYKCKELYEFCVKCTCDDFAEKFNTYITPDGIYKKVEELIKKNGKLISCIVGTKKGAYETNIKDKKELKNYILMNLQDTINGINRSVLYKEGKKGVFAIALTEEGFKKVVGKNDRNNKALQPDDHFFKGLDKLFEQRLNEGLAEAEVTVGPIMKLGYSLKQVLNPSKKMIKEVQDKLSAKERVRSVGAVHSYGRGSENITSNGDDNGSYSRPSRRKGDNDNYSSKRTPYKSNAPATYSKYGNVVYGPNGDTYARYGNVVYGPDGAYSKHGNVIYGPKGTYTTSGGNTYSSNDTYSRHGNTTYSSKDSYGKYGRNVYGGAKDHYIGVSHAFDDDDE